MSVRIIACLAALAVLLSSCGAGKTEFFYFDFVNGDVAASDWQEPNVWLYTGDKVPLKTKIDWNGEIVQFLNVNECCVPVLEIRSPFLLSDMIVTTGEFVSDYDDLLGSSCVNIFLMGENTAQLSWSYWPEHVAKRSCIRIGDEISIELIPENGSEPLIVNAVLVRSGYYWNSTL